MSERRGGLDMAAINHADDAEAAAMVLPFVERAPQLAARIAARRPFAEPMALIEAMRSEIHALEEDELIAFFRGHPELAPAEPAAMTPASQDEQARLDLTSLPAAERKKLAALNRRYAEKFGFPFITALHAHASLASVLASFGRRLQASREAEIASARDEIVAVSRARILSAFGVAEAASP